MVKPKQNQQEMSTEDLIHKVCSDFTKKIVESFDKKFDKLNEKLNDLHKVLENTNKTVNANQNTISEVENKCDIIDQNSKRNTVRICRLYEENENETVIDNVINFFSTKLDITCNKNDFDSVFRTGKNINSENPRTIIVNFISNNKRAKVLNARKLLKNQEISIFEDLTKKRFELLMAAKKKLGQKKAWSYNGNIYVWNDKSEKKCLIHSETDLLLY